MPCKLCEELMACEASMQQIREFVKKDSHDEEIHSNSYIVAMNLKNNCPCKECIVNSTCMNGLACREFVEIAFKDTSKDLKENIERLYKEQETYGNRQWAKQPNAT